MPYTVKQLAALAGVSARTLRHYDNIGLLRPQRAQNGYRAYGDAELDTLQQILFYRAAGMPLEDIARLLADKNFSPAEALQTHLAALRSQRHAIDALIATAEKTLKSLQGETTMTDKEKFEGFKQKLVDDNEKQYGAEVRQKWGDAAADASNAKMMNMTEQQYAEFTALGDELNAALKAAVESGDAAGEWGQKAAALHKKWLCFTWPQYSAEAHKNLAQMYVDDERFAAYYEKIAPGAATLLRDAVAIYVDGQK